MAFTEFCCRSGGSNLNSGTRTGSSTEPGTGADFTYTSGTWVNSTRTFTRLDAGSFVTDGMAVADFISVYVDGSSVTGYVARITTVTATTFVTSSTVFSGTNPADGTANRTAKLGGAWKGPNAAENFPFNFVTSALKNVAGYGVRVNFKNDADYNITAAITHANSITRFDGYTAAYGDGGKAAIDGGTSGASYTLLANSAAGSVTKDFIFKNNGATGSATGATFTARQNVEGCVVHDIQGVGIFFNSCMAIECEAYLCNKSNTSALGGFQNTGSVMKRCVSHDNAGSNSSGAISTNTAFFESCIFDTNGQHGINASGNVSVGIANCDCYNNGGSGMSLANNSAVYIENCNLIKNGAYGIIGNSFLQGSIVNCAFGVGTQANSSGTTNTLGAAVESGSINYATDVTPWVDPANGDFRINLAAAINAGRGTFTETAASYAGTIGYPDIGAAQHLEVPKPFGGSCL